MPPKLVTDMRYALALIDVVELVVEPTKELKQVEIPGHKPENVYCDFGHLI